MKLKATIVAATLLASPSLFAFSFNFAPYTGATLPGDLIVSVPGYGDVQFSAGINTVTGLTSNLEVSSDIFGAEALQFDNGDTVNVTFLGAAPDAGSVDWGELTLTSDTTGNFVALQPGASNFVLSFQNSNQIGGIVGATFTAVPEPSAALLGLVGVTGFLIRRRR